MEDPHPTNPVDMNGVHSPADSVQAGLQQPKPSKHAEKQTGAQETTENTAGEAVPQQHSATQPKDEQNMQADSEEAPAPGLGLHEAMTNGTNGVILPGLTDGDDKVTSTSKGIAELDLDAVGSVLHAQLDGAADFGEPFPAMPDLHLDNLEAQGVMGAPLLEEGPPKIRAFAKIEFEDGQYYINTYAVELGRDVRAAKRAQQRRFQRDIARRDRRRRGSDSSDEHPRRYAPSTAVSESGGIVNFESLDRRPGRKSKSKRSNSPSSSSFSRSRHNSTAEPAVPFDYQALAYEHLLGAQSVSEDYVPSPDDLPLIPVHPPNNEDQPGAGYGGISRRHARIAYNFDTNCFEFETLGRNGGFVDEIWLGPGEVAMLDHGSKIQIGGVMMIFLLPNRQAGTEITVASEAVSAMSFEFEDGRGESGPVVDTSGTGSSEELPQDEGSGSQESREDDDDEAGLASGEESDESENIEQSIEGGDGADASKAAVRKKFRGLQGRAKPKIKLKLKARRALELEAKDKSTKTKSKAEPAQDPDQDPKPEHRTLADIASQLGLGVDEIPTRKKGPGRPPKDGVMSKREYAQLARQQKERQKAEGMHNGMGKAGKTINGATSAALPEKRKYTKRKKPEEEGEDLDGVRESIEGGEDGNDTSSQAPKAAKEKRPPKPPRSPSPVFDESTLTPEQLAKPTQSYVVLIHEALSNSPTGQMSLPQIYRAIERRYPFYKLRVTTQGWQSSVRHNLSQHAAFRKIEKEGKGWMWGLVPEVSIEKEKKRRPSPPSAPQQNFYPPITGQQQYRSNQYSYPSGPPPPGQTPAPMPFPYQAPAPGFAAAVPEVARNFGGKISSTQSSTYQSPYTPAPSAPIPAQPAGAYASVMPATPNHAVASPYYNAPAPATPAVSAPSSAPPPTFAPPYQPAPNTFKTFATTRADVPQALLDACKNFKAKLMEQLDSTPGIGDTIDKALNRALTAVMNGEQSSPHTDDPVEKIFVNESYPALVGIWRSGSRPSAPLPHAPSSPTTETSTADPETKAASREVPTTSADAPDAKTRAEAVKPTSPTKPSTSPTPLEQHQHTPILNLLQQLGQGSGSRTHPTAETKAENASAATIGEAHAAPTQRAQVMTASREAAEKAITALNVSTKRGYEEDDETEEKAEGTSEDDLHGKRPPKRVAV